MDIDPFLFVIKNCLVQLCELYVTIVWTLHLCMWQCNIFSFNLPSAVFVSLFSDGGYISNKIVLVNILQLASSDTKTLMAF